MVTDTSFPCESRATHVLHHLNRRGFGELARIVDDAAEHQGRGPRGTTRASAQPQGNYHFMHQRWRQDRFCHGGTASNLASKEIQRV